MYLLCSIISGLLNVEVSLKNKHSPLKYLFYRQIMHHSVMLTFSVQIYINCPIHFSYYHLNVYSFHGLKVRLKGISLNQRTDVCSFFLVVSQEAAR